MRLHFAIGLASSIGFAVFLGSIVSASAAEPGAAQNTAAVSPPPPGRVGRVSLVSGTVGFRGPGDTAWSDAEINDPAARGISVRTDPHARAELRVGPDTIDLGGSTRIAIADLTDRMVEIAVPRGRIDLDIGRIGNSERIQIDIPRGGVWLLRPGRYDIEAGSGVRPPRVAAFTGRARFVGGGSDVTLDAGTAAVLGGPGSPKATGEPALSDAFTRWCRRRAVDETRLAAADYVSPAMTGLAALDAAGSWKPAGKYGEAWVPYTLPADWAPYRDGHWRWVAPWGWSWIDDRPWGFAPSHYGRWVFLDRHWSWVPGTYAAHPVYAPAVVAFLGTPGVGLSFAEGRGPAVAWFPLAPGEVYWPSYTTDRDYIRKLNAPDIADLGIIRVRADGEPPVQITNGHFANRQFASVVPRPVFVSGQAIGAALLQLPQERLRNAPAIMGSPRIGPPMPVELARIAAARAVLGQPPLEHTAVHLSAGTAWVKEVYAAFKRSRNFQRAARVRAAHLRVPVYAGAPRRRHMIILRVAHASLIRHVHETRRKVMRR